MSDVQPIVRKKRKQSVSGMTKGLTDAISKMQVNQEAILAGLKQQIMDIKAGSGQSPTKWEFDIERDPDTNLITKIVATAGGLNS